MAIRNIHADSVRVLLSDARRPRNKATEILMPTESEMLRIAKELHAARAAVRVEVLNWPVVYSPACPLTWQSTNVDLRTRVRGETTRHEAVKPAQCSFGHEREWCVTFTWHEGDDHEPQRYQDQGQVLVPVCGAQPRQLGLFDRPERGDFSEPVRGVQPTLFELPGEGVPEMHAPSFTEGAALATEQTRFERNPGARAACIKAHGVRCCACGLDFGEYYGPVAAGFIHVHHLTPLASIGEAHRVDPVEDLRPVCPNCHAVMHLVDPPMSPERLQSILSTKNLRRP